MSILRFCFASAVAHKASGREFAQHLILNTIPAYMILWPLLGKMAKARHASDNVQLNANNTPYHLCISERLYLHVCEHLTLQAVDTRPRAWFHKSKMRLCRHAWGHLICQAVDTMSRAVGRGNRWPLYSEARQGHGIKGPAFFCRLAEESWASRHCARSNGVQVSQCAALRASQ